MNFNLVHENWLSVLDLHQQIKCVSLLELFKNGDKYFDLSVRPHERIALMRLLICISQACLNGPEDGDDWGEIPVKLPDLAEAYLLKWQDRFDLFDKKMPFLQVADLRGKDGAFTPLSKLDCSLATGNNHTLFDHAGNDNEPVEFTPSQIALNLITHLCFSLGGGQSVDLLANVESGNFTDGLCSTKSATHVLFRGQNLLQTLQFNCVQKEGLGRFYNLDDFWGQPVWELADKSVNSAEFEKNATTTYLGRLASLSRFIKLNNYKTMLLTQGFKLPPFPEFQEASTVAYLKEPKSGKIIIQELDLFTLKVEKAIWRDLGSILMHKRFQASNKKKTFRLDDLNEFEYDLIVGGMIRSKASVIDIVESVNHISTKLQHENALATYNEGVAEAETMANRLGYAVLDYRKEIDEGWEVREKVTKNKYELVMQLQNKALVHYWTKTEHNLSLLFKLVEALGTDCFSQAQQAWQDFLYKNAVESFELVCTYGDTRSLKAFTRARLKIYGLTKEKAKDGNNE